MRLCSRSTDARQDDLTPLWSDHLRGGKRGEIKKKEKKEGKHHFSRRFSDQYNSESKGYINIVRDRL